MKAIQTSKIFNLSNKLRQILFCGIAEEFDSITNLNMTPFSSKGHTKPDP